ncbi:hypothetical protein KQX62_12230 [Rhodopseudomonas palustris]|uniref:Uncharacterized protein n=2 Tax=Rhodopseudomonas TaxID=1073 RepID=A0AAX3DRL3_RHOPL|nr:hypothetical protein [Rhodopseudomonas palustris]UYO37526.1 hypothetical protein KQX62_12230 [Rhodopseudomonas palustris]
MGQKRIASDDDRAAALNGGQAEAATLAEVWAVDPLILCRSVLPESPDCASANVDAVTVSAFRRAWRLWAICW